MATKADVDFSINGEQKQKSSLQSENKLAGQVGYDNGVPTDKEWYIFKLLDNTKKGGVYIPNVDDVYNPTTKVVERIRLLSGVSSIWMKDQKDLTPDFIRQNARTIEFPRGHKIRRVPAHDTTMLEFMRLCNFNICVKKRTRVVKSDFQFFEYDSATAEKEAFIKEEFELEQALAAKAEPLEKMRKHAAFLGMRLINDIGEPKSEDGIRREYVMYAKRNPQYFKDTKGTNQVEVSWMIKKAIADSKIEIGREPGKVFWAKNGGFICAIPQSTSPEQYLLELALTPNEEGLKFKEQLQRVAT